MSGQNSIVEFIRARLDALERLALAVQQETGPVWPAGDELLGGTIYTEQGGYVLGGTYGGDLSWEMRQYLEAVGPGAMLADIEVKRRMLDEHPRCDCHDGCTACVSCGDGSIWPCSTIRLLALPHADEPGYLNEWRPE